MTSIPSDNHVEAPVERGAGRRAGFRSEPRAARILLLIVFGTALAVTAPFLESLSRGAGLDGDAWFTFGVLGLAAAIAHLFVVHAPPNQSYHTSVVFLIAAALLLPPELLVLIGILVNIPEWLKERYRWYIQGFNICNYTLNTLAAAAAFHAVRTVESLFGSEDVVTAAAGVAACVTFVGLNHTLLALMLHFSRGRSFRETGLFSGDSISVDLVLTTLGVALATFWTANPWLIPIAIAPLLVVHRSLSVPQLQAEARIDPKTGLYNARYFASALSDELGRASRFGRPLSVIMADLDLLRDINNTHGHLAGDAVLKGIAELFRQQLRHYDVPARFGGEEFSILLPETPPEQALEIAERIRGAVAARTYDVETSREAIRATVSIGVAAFPKDATGANDLVHQADLAVYRAKLQGRNRVVGASAELLAAS